MGSFTGKVALVAGGTSGIGRAAAVALAREGAKVVVAGRRKAEGGETVRLVREAGSQGLFVRADVAKESDVRAMIEATLAEYGRLDAAFNNAGVEEDPGPLGSKGEEVYDHIMDVNVKGVWLSLKHEIPAMLRTGGGSIVNAVSHNDYALVEPDRVTIVYPGGNEIRDRSYRLVLNPKLSRDNLRAAMQEMGRFYH